VAQHMEPRAWARACCATRSMYAARVRVVRARPTSTERPDGWALEQWPAAHSLFLDLRAVADLPRLAAAAGAAPGARDASPALLRTRWALRALRCLHVIGHGERMLEGRARVAAGVGAGCAGPPGRGVDAAWSRAAEGAAAALAALLGNIDLPPLRVLSLDVALLGPLPGSLAGLRHLVLRVDADAAAGCGGGAGGAGRLGLAAVAGSLPALRTLHVEAAPPGHIVWAPGADLRACRHLEALALAGVHDLEAVAVPEGCRVAAVLPVGAVADWVEFAGGAARAGLRGRLDALTVHASGEPAAGGAGAGACGVAACGERRQCLGVGRSRLYLLSRELGGAALAGLGELRILLRAGGLPAGAERHELVLKLDGRRLPALRVLAVDVPCALRLRLTRMGALRTLALAAHALAELRWQPSAPGAHAWAAVSMRAAAAPPAEVCSALRDLLGDACYEAGFGAAGAAGAWQGAVPARFRPGELFSCGCRACLACLGRAGVPVAAAQAWRHEGFDRLW